MQKSQSSADPARLSPSSPWLRRLCVCSSSASLPAPHRTVPYHSPTSKKPPQIFLSLPPSRFPGKARRRGKACSLRSTCAIKNWASRTNPLSECHRHWSIEASVVHSHEIPTSIPLAFAIARNVDTSLRPSYPSFRDYLRQPTHFPFSSRPRLCRRQLSPRHSVGLSFGRRAPTHPPSHLPYISLPLLSSFVVAPRPLTTISPTHRCRHADHRCLLSPSSPVDPAVRIQRLLSQSITLVEPARTRTTRLTPLPASCKSRLHRFPRRAHLRNSGRSSSSYLCGPD